MMSQHSLSICLALDDLYAGRVGWDGENFRWCRQRGTREIHPDNRTLKAVIKGIVEVIN